jgi:hypothetical protein
VACLERRTLSFVSSTLTFARTFRLSTLLTEPNELWFIAVFNDDSVRLAARMVRRADGLIKALKRMATAFDLRHYFFLLFFSKSASAFLAPPLPEMKLLTRPIAHAAIGTLRDPLDR